MNNNSPLTQKETITISARFKNLKKIRAFIEKFARKAGFDESETYKIQLAVDEACTNIIEHAYEKENEGNIICACEFKEDKLTIQLVDYGRSFDPERIEPPDLQSTLQDRKTGGLGLYFIRQLMDEVSFKIMPEGKPNNDEGFIDHTTNVLVMVKRKSQPK
jgi:anti-sigma regulatory factor (Ser/Thr protein kinase)